MTLDTLAKDYLSCLIKNSERRTPAGVDFFFFCCQNGIAITDLQPFVARLKSEGLVIEPYWGIYALTASGHVQLKRCADKTRLRRKVSRAEAAMRIGLIRLGKGLGRRTRKL